MMRRSLRAACAIFCPKTCAAASTWSGSSAACTIGTDSSRSRRRRPKTSRRCSVNYGDEGNKLIFKILKRGEHEASGEADLALRYDLTVPLARVIAEYQSKLPKIFKRYQIQPVWRADRPARGRFREFYQCDIDSVGSTSPVVEAEQIAAVSEILTTLGFDDFVIRINHRKFIAAWLNQIPIPADRHADVLITIDKVDKVGKEGVAKELAEKSFSDSQIAGITGWIGAHHPPQWLDSLDATIPRRGDTGVENLRQIIRLTANDGTRLTGSESIRRWRADLAITPARSWRST